MARKPYKKKRDQHPGHYLREWREYRGLTIERVAERVELSVPQISKIENGKQGFRQETLEAFAHAYSCKPADLLRPPPTDSLMELERLINRLEPNQTDRALQILRIALPEAA